MAYSGSPEDKLGLFLGAAGVIALGGIVVYVVYTAVKWIMKKTTQSKTMKSTNMKRQ